MEFRILGPLEVSEDGRQVDLGGGTLRALLVRSFALPDCAAVSARLRRGKAPLKGYEGVSVDWVGPSGSVS